MVIMATELKQLNSEANNLKLVKKAQEGKKETKIHCVVCGENKSRDFWQFS